MIGLIGWLKNLVWRKSVVESTKTEALVFWHAVAFLKLY